MKKLVLILVLLLFAVPVSADNLTDPHRITVVDYTKGAASTNLVSGNSYNNPVNFTVTSVDACVVIAEDAQHNFIRLLTDSFSGNTRSFNIVLESDTTIYIAKKGDVDLNGSVQSKDMFAIQKHIINPTENPFNSVQFLVADVNLSDSIQSKDMYAVQSHVIKSKLFTWDSSEWTDVEY